jgi:hypothetical protein
MISALKSERGIEKMAAHNAAAQAPQVDIDHSLAKAEEHKNKLLAFQRENARRTKVVDEVADFDTPEVSSWMSPVERAKALKAQQRYAREMEEKNRPEWERKKMVMSLDVSGGKVRRMYNRVEASSLPVSSGDVSEDDGDEEPGEDVGGGDVGRGGTFTTNPLLVGGGSGNFKLVRPIWTDKHKGKEVDKSAETGSDESAKERMSTWRRVQDDNGDDGERWVLDGGVYGFETGKEGKGDEPDCG